MKQSSCDLRCSSSASAKSPPASMTTRGRKTTSLNRYVSPSQAIVPLALSS